MVATYSSRPILWMRWPGWLSGNPARLPMQLACLLPAPSRRIACRLLLRGSKSLRILKPALQLSRTAGSAMNGSTRLICWWPRSATTACTATCLTDACSPVEVAEGVNGPLLELLVEAASYHDAAAVQLFREGAPLVSCPLARDNCPACSIDLRLASCRLQEMGRARTTTSLWRWGN